MNQTAANRTDDIIHRLSRNVEEFKARNVNGFDYANQAWVINGKYQRCGHPVMFVCDCYGRKHEGETLATNAEVH